MKNALLILFIVLAISAKAQNSTDELLGASKVKSYVHFNIVDNKLYYQIDKNTDKKSHKTLPSDFCVVMRKSDNEMALVFDFLNPFKKKIVIAESTESDGAYESLSKFYALAKALGDQVSNSSASETGKSVVAAASYQFAGQSVAVGSAKVKVAMLTAKNLMAWKYAFLSGQQNCIKSADLFDLLVKADTAFYRKSSDANIETFFSTEFDNVVKALLAQESVTSLKAYRTELEKSITLLTNKNESSTKLLSSLKEWNYDNTFNTNPVECVGLKDYSKEAINNFVDDANALLVKRKALVTALKDINVNITKFLADCDEEDNTMIVKRIPVSFEMVKMATIKVRDVQVKNENQELTVIEDEKKDVELGKLRLRNYHFFIPEFALGAFYTNLNYPVYGTTTNNGITEVSPAENQNYSFIAAAHLNLVMNLGGLVNPMIQFGIGTAKELPSFLAGAGMRLSKPNHLSISFGSLWTWKKELDKLKVGSVISSTSDLEKDLKNRFITKPAFYLGINLGF